MSARAGTSHAQGSSSLPEPPSPKPPLTYFQGAGRVPLPPPIASPSVFVQERYCTHVFTPMPTCPGLCELTTALTEMCPWQNTPGVHLLCPGSQLTTQVREGPGQRLAKVDPQPADTACGVRVSFPGSTAVWYPAGPARVGMRGVTTEGRWLSGIQGLLVWPTGSPCPPTSSRGTQLLSVLWKSMKHSSYMSRVPISAVFAESSCSPVWPPLPSIPQPWGCVLLRTHESLRVGHCRQGKESSGKGQGRL